jgi:hypothetical protein
MASCVNYVAQTAALAAQHNEAFHFMRLLLAKAVTSICNHYAYTVRSQFPGVVAIW